jgi:DNA-directed RNA polymerase subunit F
LTFLQEEDIHYLRNAFALDMTDAEAAKKFTDDIYRALKTKTVIVNDLIHVWAHRKDKNKDKKNDKK